jgi:hypothetical protein
MGESSGRKISSRDKENLRLDGKIILKRIIKESGVWNSFGSGQTLVKVVMNLRVLRMLRISLTSSQLSVCQVEVTLQLTFGRSVSMSSCRAYSGTCDQILLVLSLWGRPLWREVGSVICHSQSAVISSIYFKHLSYVCFTVQQFIYNIYKASFSPVWVQQIMFY